MPAFSLDQAFGRAIQIQRRIQDLRIEHHGRELGAITASLSLASFPDHGRADRLLQTVDAALLRAKAEGRDRVRVATVRDAASAVA